MTSLAKRGRKTGGLPSVALAAAKTMWKMPAKLPTVPVDIGTATFVGRIPGVPHQRIDTANNTFVVHVRPIPKLASRPAPLAEGPTILRAFLWARQHYPHLNFMEVKDRALDAVYQSHRVDGLPRVVFGLLKDVRTVVGAKVQLSGVLRHRFKRRARQAFREAMEQIKNKSQSNRPAVTPFSHHISVDLVGRGFFINELDSRWDVDLLFLMKGNALLLPYQKLVDDMRQVLSIGFHSRIYRSGYEQAQLSTSFLNPEPVHPRHILSLLAEELDVREFNSEEEKRSLYRRLREEDAQLPRLTDLNELAKTLVRGVVSEMPVLGDGTMKMKMLKINDWTRKDPQNMSNTTQLKMTEPEMNRSLQVQRLESLEPTTNAQQVDDPRLAEKTSNNDIQTILQSASARPRSTPRNLNKLNTSMVQRHERQLKANVVEQTTTEPGSQLGLRHPALAVAFQGDRAMSVLTLEHPVIMSLFFKKFKYYDRQQRALILRHATSEPTTQMRPRKSPQPVHNILQSTSKRPVLVDSYPSKRHKQRLKAMVMEQASEPISQVRLETPSLVEGTWKFPPSTSPARRGNFAEKSERDSLNRVMGKEEIESERTTRRKSNSRRPRGPQLSSNAGESYEHASFDWLLEPESQTLDGTRAQDSLRRSLGTVSASQWVPQEIKDEVHEDEDWDDEQELESLERDLEKLFPDQSDEKDWGLKDDKDSFEGPG